MLISYNNRNCPITSKYYDDESISDFITKNGKMPNEKSGSLFALFVVAV